MLITSPTHAMPGPHDVTRVTLDNGMVVLIRENHAAPVVVVEGFLRAGSIHEPADRAGLASFVASMVTRGSAAYDFDAFNETVEGVGASLGVSADDHTTGFGLTSLSEDFPTLLGVLADVLQHPTFPAGQIPRLRNQKLVHIQERDQDTQQVANLRFYASLFPDHPYGRANSGYANTIGAITRADLEAFHAARYTAAGSIIVIVGDLETAAALDLVQAHFGDWRGPVPDDTVPPIPVLGQIVEQTVALPDKIQSDIVIGCQAVARSHPDFYNLRVANTILGRFGMMGRLGERVREEQGLAYYVYGAQDAGLKTGVWLAAAGVNPLHVDQAITSILAEFARLREEPVSADELADSQAYMTGVLPLTLETNEGVAATLLNMEYHDLGLDYLQRYAELIYGVTAADVQRVAAAYLRPDAYSLVVAGPADEQSEE